MKANYLTAVKFTSFRPFSAQPKIPCLFYTNNSRIPSPKTARKPLNPADSMQLKTIISLRQNVEYFIEKYGYNNVGFLTLTFGDKIRDPKEAQRRFNSFRTDVLSSRYLAYIRVLELHDNNCIHYHLVVAFTSDIRTGFDFDAYNFVKHSRLTAPIRRRLTTNATLRAEWDALRRLCKSHGFGRHEVIPLRKDASAVAFYLSKYLAKTLVSRPKQLKGVRLVEYSRGAKICSTRFSYVSKRASTFRQAIPCFISDMASVHRHPATSDAMALHHGKNWLWKFRAFIVENYCNV